MLQPMIVTPKILDRNSNSKRNRFPKLSLNYSVTFQLATGEFHADALEISHDELRIICPAGDIPLLVPRTAHHRPGEKIIHSATLQFEEDFSINAKLQVLGCRRYSQQGFNVAFRIAELGETQLKKLEGFLIAAIRKNVPTANMFG
ncbi:MAG: hypothetical protein GX029_02235 [Pseudomonadaceae bacterium]|nr:hypothetical protein [Pseudomonadaceae bacterium]